MGEPAGAASVGGAVEREARQLVEAAARWLSAVPDSGGRNDEGPAAVPDEGPDEVPDDGEYAVRSGEAFEAEEVNPDDETTLGAAPPWGEREADGSREEHLCRGCPWCRAKAAAGPIGADTLESLAHLLGSAAESLALFAQSRREAAAREAAHREAAHREAGDPATTEDVEDAEP